MPNPACRGLGMSPGAHRSDLFWSQQVLAQREAAVRLADLQVGGRIGAAVHVVQHAARAPGRALHQRRPQHRIALQQPVERQVVREPGRVHGGVSQPHSHSAHTQCIMPLEPPHAPCTSAAHSTALPRSSLLSAR